MIKKFCPMKDYGLVSIITPNYNCAAYIAETIESVLAQTYPNWELLIQDDCSTDDSMQIARKYAEADHRIKIQMNEKNSGAAVTRNNAILRSQGEFLAFLDSDDVWLPRKLELQLDFMAQKGCDFSFTSYEHMDECGKSLGVQARVVRYLSYRRMMMHCWPGCLTVVYKQDLNHKIYARDVKKNNDHALFLQVLRCCKVGMGLDECLALYRIRRGSISRNKLKVVKPYVKVLHEFEGHSLLISYLCVLTHVFVKIFLKYRKISPEQSCVLQSKKDI